MSITQEQRQIIRTLAGSCCEFCRVREDKRFSKFQIDHIIPKKHGGRDEIDNLYLACLNVTALKALTPLD